MKQYEMFEMTYHPKSSEEIVSADNLELSAIFEKDGAVFRTNGFAVEDGTYKVRFYPGECGIYHYKVDGITDAEGDLICEPASATHHGMVCTDGTHFRYEDGTWYYPFGTTVYALAHQEEWLMHQTMETLAQAPFNKIRMCIFPKHADYNSNDPELYAFEKTDGAWDVNKPCLKFWDKLEGHITELNRMGIQCDLILFHPYDRWGFSKLTRAEGLTYLDYAVRRLAAFPNLWWSLGNEYDLMSYEKADWECFARFLKDNDCYGHLLSNHNMVQHWDFSNPATSHICLQIKDINHVSKEIKKFQKPLMVDECRYEGNVPFEWGNISGFEMADRFWKICLQGGYCTHGETYLNKAWDKQGEPILWWSKGGKLYGESTERIRFLKEILESLPGPLTYVGKDTTEESVEIEKSSMPEEMKQMPIFRAMFGASWKELKDLMDANREFIGNCKEEVFIKYYSRNRTCIGSMKLPEDGWYDLEVIDIWEMTREKVLGHVQGNVEVGLPGKEGMALLARKITDAEYK